MSGIWRQLIWKEWREQFWKMIALAAILITVDGYLFFGDTRAGLDQLGFGLLAGVPGAFFVALGVAASERTARSLDFVRSFPLARWKWAVVRLAMGAVASLVPIVAAATVILLLSWSMRSAGNVPRYLRDVGLSALGCVVVYAWTAAAGVRRSSELRAGLAAICFFIGWIVLLALAANLSSAESPRMLNLVWVFGPGGLTLFPDRNYPAAVNPFSEFEVLSAQAASLLVAAWWFTRCYARLTTADNRSPTAVESTVPAQLRPPRSSPFAAMIWKEYREALPMCAAGLAIVAALVLPFMINIGGPGYDRALDFVASFIVFIGTMMALVLGVGGHAADLDTDVWHFWQSRPIRTTGWFWIKYFTGAVVLVVAFDGALAVIDLLAGGRNFLLRDGKMWLGPIVHLFAYSTAVWMVCQLRQPIYAGILGLALVGAVLVLGEYPADRPLVPWLSLSNVSHPRFDPSLPDLFRWVAATYVPFALPMLALSAICAVLGWLAVTRSNPWSCITGAARG
ncbi:MAG TPA: hypothetical protein VHC22_20025 [Pirellulales bacterium]|nr:hypothetical protein [Pirellulales bacterium]